METSFIPMTSHLEKLFILLEKFFSQITKANYYVNPSEEVLYHQIVGITTLLNLYHFAHENDGIVKEKQ